MRRVLYSALVLLLSLPSRAQTPSATIQTQRAISAFNRAKSNPLQLHAFLVDLPKGADLHMHLTGTIYAETFLQDATADHLCVDLVTHTLIKNIGTTRSIPPQPVCAKGQVTAASAFKDQNLYDDLVDAFSMRGFVPSPGITAHDQFFSTFARFDNGTIDDLHTGEWLDQVATRAAAQNEQYLEIMKTPTFSHAAKLGFDLGWPIGTGSPIESTGEREVTREQLAKLRDALLAGGLRDDVALDKKELANAQAKRNAIENCSSNRGSENSIGTAPHSNPCTVKIRFLGQVLRAFPPQQVFAQTLLYFELASTDPDVVGINFVQPEDAYLSLSEYVRQMQMLDYLHSVYPRVHIALHAGELAPGLVPPNDLRLHIHQAIDLGHAERIGHGADIMYEDNPNALLKEMADRHIMVEINLTSNDIILGIAKSNHPLPLYRAAHVPVALSSDDEGVSRIDITHEYVRAVTDFNLGYLDLKNMARTSLEHSFLPGSSLWRQPDVFNQTALACSTEPLGAKIPSAKCRAFLASSERATQQWELESRYKAFESSLSEK